MEARPATPKDPTRHVGADPPLRHEPPRCPEGWATGAPDFVGVGAARSGTTWWFQQITCHPGVVYDWRLHRKEVHFFSSRRQDRERLPDQYAEIYARYFPRPPGAGRIGEWTPRYMLDRWAMRQLRQVAPSARILLMLRDPVARYASAYARVVRQERRRGRSRDPEPAIESEVTRGLYVPQIQRVLDAFPRESVLILQYERCCEEYERELDRTWEFLGVEAGFRPPGKAENMPLAKSHQGFLDDQLGRKLAGAYAEDARRLTEIAPEIDLSLWPSVADLP